MERNDQSFEDVRSRLEEIVDEVNAEGVSLDDALKLYEEAVKLGLSACELSESDLLPEELQPEEAAPAAAEGEDAPALQADPEAIKEAFEASDIAEAALIEQVGDAASVQTPASVSPVIAGEVEGDGSAPHSR